MSEPTDTEVAHEADPGQQQLRLERGDVRAVADTRFEDADQRSARVASRRELRETPNLCVSSRSVGRREPAVNSPELISSLIFAIAWSVARPTLMSGR